MANLSKQHIARGDSSNDLTSSSNNWIVLIFFGGIIESQKLPSCSNYKEPQSYV